MPNEGIELTENENLLTTEEIVRVARIFVQQGVDKIRLTGGEPTVRKDIIQLISELDKLRPLGLRKIAITTNGIALRLSLRDLLRDGASDQQVVDTISRAIKRKHRAHAGMDILAQMPNRPMIKIGG
ncbi:hypothetical protein GGI07_002049 [Coemansia sp. Benny D115]|nr:hypothetical protein GGI07_002049 [Coemansia sp. Benny D115]